MSDADIDELYAWIDTIPLSRPKKNISRDFADGVLLAEVIQHHLPKYVDLHNYPAASGATQRKVNWETLNRRVLVKIGVRISDETIQHLIDAKPGVIEQVLLEIRSKIDELRLGTRQYRAKSQGPTTHIPCPCKGESRTRMSVIRVDFEKPAETGSPKPKSTSVIRVDCEKPAEPASPKPKAKEMFKEQELLVGPTVAPTFKTPLSTGPDNNNNEDTREEFPTSPVITNKVQDIPSPKPVPVETAVPPNNYGYFCRKPSQGYVAPPTATSVSRASLRSSASRTLRSAGSDRAPAPAPDEPPAQIIYRGHKMVPLQLLDEKEKALKQLETTNRSLTLKIFRLETLVNIKDQRVEDLTHQLQSLRAMYERVTEKTLAAAGVKSTARPEVAP